MCFESQMHAIETQNRNKKLNSLIAAYKYTVSHHRKYNVCDRISERIKLNQFNCVRNSTFRHIINLKLNNTIIIYMGGSTTNNQLTER